MAAQNNKNRNDINESEIHFSGVKSKQFKRRRIDFKLLILSCGFLVVIGVVGFVLVEAAKNTESKVTHNEVKSVLSSEEIREYASPENDFYIKFPGVPKIEKSTYTEDGQEIQLTTFQRSIDEERTVYTLQVHNYSDKKVSVDILDKKLNEKLNKHLGSKVTSSKIDSHNGDKYVEAVYTYDDRGTKKAGIVRILQHGSSVYLMDLIPGDREKFNEFANSLRFK